MADQENTRRGEENSTMSNSPTKRSRFSVFRHPFEIDVELNPYDYEAWHEYIDFEKNGGNIERIRKVFDNAVEYIPRETTKRSWWPHYIYLWLRYAWFEEIEAKDAERARCVYSRFLQLIPHHKFSFEKVWLSAATFEINQSNYENATNILESAIEWAPTVNIFKIYIDMKSKLGDINACRELHRRCIQCAPDDDYFSWMDYIEFEKSQSNPDTVRLIYDIAVSRPALKDSAHLWFSYIDFEILEDDPDKARDLFEKLLEQNKELYVWIKYVRFEASIAILLLQKEEEAVRCEKKKRVIFAETYIQQVREIFRKALRHFTASTRPNYSEVQIRAKLLQEWEYLERSFGSMGNVNLVLDLVARFNRRNEGIILS